MTLALIKEILAEDNPDAYIYDGLDDAIIGLIYKDDGPVLAYSFIACIGIFMERDGMSSEGAVEFFYFNVDGLRLGEHQPVIVYDTSVFIEDEANVNDSS